MAKRKKSSKATDSLGLRNGIKLRNGRPRWEPSPANRAAGIKGRDMRDLHGAWINDRGLLTTLADARLDWAGLYREALAKDASGIEARANMRELIERLPPAISMEDRLKRANVADILEKCIALVQQSDETYTTSTNGITVNDLVKSYLAAIDSGEAASLLSDNGEEIPIDISANTIRQYKTQLKKLVTRFDRTDITTITAGNMKGWYEQIAKDISIHTANVAIGAAGAVFRWAIWKGWLTPAEFPVQKIGRHKAAGRRVYWPLKVEMAFEEWCDANGYEDVADAVVGLCWSGARQVDLCKAYTHELLNSWTYMPQKTAKRGVEAMPGVMPRFTRRIELRNERARRDGVSYLPNAVPFLFNPVTKKLHNSNSIGTRFRDARREAARSGEELFEELLELRLQDTRDTCVTRLFMAEIPLANIIPWTGHSAKSAEDILRDHYRVIREEEALETTRRFELYAKENHLKL